MPRRAAGLTAAKVRTAKPGRYGDGGGLYLLVRSPEARFRVFRYTLPGAKMRELGLGRAGGGPGAVALAEARERAADLYRLVKAGVGPLAKREADTPSAAAEDATAAIRGKTFRDVAGLFLASHEAGWRNPKHRQQWRNTLDAYAHPHMGAVPVAEVATAHVMAALEPIWTVKPETASRLRGRIEAVLDTRRRGNGGAGRTRRAGAATSPGYCRRRAGWPRWSTTPPCPGATSVPLWRRCASGTAWRPARWSSPS